MSKHPTSALPPLYTRWMDEVLADRIPEETDATCADCAMCPRDGQAHSRSGFFYNPETKCCTYIPTLPNFLVGKILGDHSAALAVGRATVETRLGTGLAVTPLGLGMPPAFSFLYSGTAEQTFGRSKTLRCPHYLADAGGRCGIWQHRAAVCATWHCKHVRGAVGAQFWKSLYQLLCAAEQSLSQWCVYELDIGVEALRTLFPAKNSLKQEHALDGLALDGKVDRAVYAMAWGKWSGRETAFYREAARLVDGLAWCDIVTIGGTELKIRERLVRDAHSKLASAELPPFLTVGNLGILQMNQKACRVTTYSPLDPLDIPNSLIAVLPYFNGQPTTQSMAAIEAREGIKLSLDLVRKLVDFGILIPVNGVPRS